MEFVTKMDRFGREIAVNKTLDPNGFLLLAHDFDTLTGRQNVYLSVTYLRQLAQRNPELQLVPADELQSARDAAAQLASALAQEKARADEAEAKIASYQDGFKQVLNRKPPARQGRPPKEKVAA